MKTNQVLLGKRVLVVDDERDVLDLMIDLLRVCKIDTAASFEEAKGLLESNPYDIAVLDIMGVNGFDLLKIATSRNIPALMLTAHALNSGSLDKSIKDGAAYFVPKDQSPRSIRMLPTFWRRRRRTRIRGPDGSRGWVPPLTSFSQDPTGERNRRNSSRSSRRRSGEAQTPGASLRIGSGS